ncbi:hypothetical protein HK105_209376 [Polyrhizophydium stewartii]|uniref:Arrestin C-terminal-like domain-containing protein n=1 Tax=Polyrhizophydium stewartii TaxID=2732419 RepID=A0ABR4MV98_9FUNG|nr:hypothetical protein HK105_001512 [Polyrhizophydium stewartii]
MSVLKLSLDKAEYAPGDPIVLSCTLHNAELVTGLRLVAGLALTTQLKSGFKNMLPTSGISGDNAYAVPHGSVVDLAEIRPLHTVTLWRAARPSGQALHPKPRSFSAMLVVPIDAVPSVALKDHEAAFLRYSIRAELTTADVSDKLLAVAPVTVVMPLPLENPPLQLPSLPKSSLAFAVDIAASFDRSVYAVGDTVAINLAVSNADKREIKSLTVNLIERRFADLPSELVCSTTITSESMGMGVSQGATRNTSVLLRSGSAASMAPSVRFSFFSVEHFVQIQVIPTGMLKIPFSIEVPITFVGKQRLPA